MSPRARYDYHDLQPAVGSFLDDVVAGLSAPRKILPPKYFYDARGSQLFNAICELPEYYPTRTELAMLEAASPEIAARIGPRSEIVEYGSGSGRKTALLIEAAQPQAYVAIDISGEQLREAVSALAERFPRVHMIAVCADYTQPLALADLERIPTERRIIYFPGSTIGNFTVDEALAFLRNARGVAGSRGAMLVGVDLKKDPALLHAAYNDAQGVTAAFNINMLHRINRELQGDFDIESFEHRAFYDERAGRIEMHLVSLREQTVTVAGRRFPFKAGETIHTESSYKYSVDEFQALAGRAGFVPGYCWVDPQRLFSIHYLTVPR
jgi:dimethylhistidine N-methyltransferase